MNTTFDEASEDVLSFDVPDDVVERAALSDQRIVTIVYCTQDYFSCWPQ